MSWKLQFTSKATKDLKKAERSISERVLKTLKRLAEGDPSVDIRKLETRPGEWRLRVGEWRVIYSQEPETKTLVVLRVLPRGKDTYR